MKKQFIFILTILLIVLAGCNLFEQSVVSENETAEPTQTMEDLSTTESVSPTSYWLDFDPHNPLADWVPPDREAWYGWMEDEGLFLTEDDYTFGDFRLGMTKEEAAPSFPSEPLSESINQIGDITLTFDTFELVFLHWRDNSFRLYSVGTTDPSFPTPRGLRVGDDVETLISLYGIPSRTWHENWWSFGDRSFNPLRITVINGVIEELYLSGMIWHGSTIEQ